MPTDQLAPDIPPDLPTDVLAAEQAHLAASRAALAAMRAHAQSLSADAAGDWVSQQILQSLLDQRVAALADHPDTPLFFGRLDRSAADDLPTTIHVGRRHVHDGDSRPLVIDWRADDHVVMTGPAEWEWSGKLDPATGAFIRDEEPEAGVQ